MSTPYRDVVPLYPEADRPLTLEEAQAALQKAKAGEKLANQGWVRYQNADPSMAILAMLTWAVATGEVNYWAMTVRQLRLERKVDHLLDLTEQADMDRKERDRG